MGAQGRINLPAAVLPTPAFANVHLIGRTIIEGFLLTNLPVSIVHRILQQGQGISEVQPIALDLLAPAPMKSCDHQPHFPSSPRFVRISAAFKPQLSRSSQERYHDRLITVSECTCCFLFYPKITYLVKHNLPSFNEDRAFARAGWMDATRVLR